MSVKIKQKLRKNFQEHSPAPPMRGQEAVRRRAEKGRQLGNLSISSSTDTEVTGVDIRNLYAQHAKDARNHLREQIAKAESSTQVFNNAKEAKEARKNLREQLNQPAETRVTTPSPSYEQNTISPSNQSELSGNNLRGASAGNHERKKPSRLRKVMALGAVALSLVGFSFLKTNDTAPSAVKHKTPVVTTTTKPSVQPDVEVKVTPVTPSAGIEQASTQLNTEADTPWDALTQEFGSEDAAEQLNKIVTKSDGQLVEHGSGSNVYVSIGENGPSDAQAVITKMNDITNAS